MHSLEGTTGISIYNLKVRATPAKVRLVSLHKVPYPGTPSADVFSWTNCLWLADYIFVTTLYTAQPRL